MNNEELAIRIRDGKKELAAELWKQVQPFIIQQANKYLVNYPPHFRQRYDDMIQESYLRMIKAVEGYDISKGKFITYLSYFLPDGFKVALYGDRTIRAERDPLNECDSLERCLYDDKTLTLSDVMIDTHAETVMRRMEESSFWSDVNRLIREAIEHLPEQEQRELMQCMYAHGVSVTKTSRLLNWSMAKTRRTYSKARANLRAYLNRADIREKVKYMALDDYISYSGISLQAYRNSCGTSQVEKNILRFEELEAHGQTLGKVFRS